MPTGVYTLQFVLQYTLENKTKKSEFFFKVNKHTHSQYANKQIDSIMPEEILLLTGNKNNNLLPSKSTLKNLSFFYVHLIFNLNILNEEFNLNDFLFFKVRNNYLKKL